MRDIECVVAPPVRSLVLPNVSSADHLRAIADVVQECEYEKGMIPGHARLVAVVEDADGRAQQSYGNRPVSPPIVGHEHRY